MPLHLLLLPLLLTLALCHSQVSRTPPTCATLALTRALESSSCSELSAAEADVATQNALHCLLTHVGASPPSCLSGTQPSSCLSSVPPSTYEAFRALRARWPSLCAAAAAQKLVQSLRGAVSNARRSGGGEGGSEEAARSLKNAKEAAASVLETNLQMLAEAPALREAAGEARKAREEVKKGRRGRERTKEEVGEAMRKVEEAVKGVRQAVGRVQAAAERMGESGEGVDKAAVAGFGDAALLACAVVGGGGRGKLVATGLGMVGGLRVANGLVVGVVRDRVEVVVWVVRVVLAVLCLGWLGREEEAELERESWGGPVRRSESVEETSPYFDDEDDDDDDEGEDEEEVAKQE